MARIQYQRSAKAGGYRPQQVDERNIARMREETSRQIEGMRTAANAEIESRRAVARAMEENADYTAGAEKRNFQIQTQNTQREIEGLQAQARRDQTQAAIDQESRESIFSNISKFSKTASELSVKIQEAKDEEKAAKERRDLQQNGLPFEEDIGRQFKELEINQTSVNINASVDENNAKGGDPLAGAKVREQEPGINYRLSKTQLNYLTTDVRSRELHKFLQARREEGKLQNSEELSQALSEFDTNWYRLPYYQGVSPKLYSDGLEEARKSDNSLVTTQRRTDTLNTDQRTTDKLVTTIEYSTAKDLKQNVLTSFDTLKRIHGNKSALDKLMLALNVRDAEGNYRYTVDQIQDLELVYDKKNVKLLDKWPNRIFELKQERLTADNKYRTLQQNADKLAQAELEDTLVRAVMENPTVERLQEAQQMFTATAFRESQKLAVVEKHLTYTAQHKQNIISSVSKLRDFELTPEIVAAAIDANPTDGAKVKARYDAYNAKWKSESYKDSTKSVETVISGTTSFGTTKAAEAGALPMIANLKAELRNRTAMYEPTLGFEAAHQKAAGELANEYRDGYRNKDSKFYRKVSRNGTVSYPNLPVGNVSAAEQTKRDITGLRTSVKTIGVEGVLDTPLSVTSAERLDYIKKNFYKDTFKPTPKELAFIGMTKGMPLHEAYNRFFEANGDSFRLNSPLRLNGKEVTLTPEDRKILGDPTKGPQAKLAVINRIINPGMFQSAATMRAGSPLQRTLVTQARDDSARSLGSDFVIEGGKRGAEYLFPADATVLKVVTGRNEEYRRETGDQRRGYGNNVEVRMQTPYGPADFLFAHFDKIGNLKPGQTVKAGTFMGTQGRTGSTTGAHVSVDAFYPDSFNPNRQAREWFLKTFLQQ
jgi:hypothetical protein